MFCCDNNALQENLKFSMQETEKGLRIDIEPKDPSKKKSLQALSAACKDFCGCNC